jgi:hypothetical protein
MRRLVLWCGVLAALLIAVPITARAQIDPGCEIHPESVGIVTTSLDECNDGGDGGDMDGCVFLGTSRNCTRCTDWIRVGLLILLPPQYEGLYVSRWDCGYTVREEWSWKDCGFC